jgi:hypothetical protein
MYCSKNKTDVKQSNLKLTNEEINSVNGFENLSGDDADKLADFIYNISIILYKTNDNGKS